MQQTNLSLRQIVMVVLVFVIFFCGIMITALIVSPSVKDPPEVTRQYLITFIAVGALSLAYFIWLSVRSIQDRRRGIEHAPAQVSNWFHIGFGAFAAVGGICCSALSYWSAVQLGAGVWTLYSGMILWGLIEILLGAWRIRTGRDSTLTNPVSPSTHV